MSTNFRRTSFAACAVIAATIALSQPAAHAAKTTECAKVGVCYGVKDQIRMLFDGRAATPPESEAPVSEGYVGKCPL